MNKEMMPGQYSFFTPANTKQKKSIYNLTWKRFYNELHRLGIKRFLSHYGYSTKRKLRLFIAKSNLSQKKITLYDFERNTQLRLFALLGNSFFDKVTRQPNFDAKQHKFSTIHYYMYCHSLNFSAISLGFSNNSSFLYFLAWTLPMSGCGENMAQNLRINILTLQKVEPTTLRRELGDLYDKPLIKNPHFIKYNYTLEELKLALEKENITIVVASLGVSTSFCVNKKLQTLRPIINVSLQGLKLRSWEALMENTPILLWKIKLCLFFSGRISVEQWANLCRPEPQKPNINFDGQFFTSQLTQQRTQAYTEETDTPLQLHNVTSSSFYYSPD